MRQGWSLGCVRSSGRLKLPASQLVQSAANAVAPSVASVVEVVGKGSEPVAVLAACAQLLHCAERRRAGEGCAASCGHLAEPIARILKSA
jgi:hypothetical protein